MALPTSLARLDEITKRGYSNWFANQTIFLTGSTGSLGGCLLYKLAVQLPTGSIFLLVRDSPQRAVDKWMRAMPDQTRAILHTNKIHYVVGDISRPDLGLSESDLLTLRERVTLVIHAAANIVLDADLRDSMRNNCLPCLELARTVAHFRRMRLLVQISTAYVNSFLPDGHVMEKLYAVTSEQQQQDQQHEQQHRQHESGKEQSPDKGDDPEEELAEIMATGRSPYAPLFASPYAYAKHLMERLLLKRYPQLPVLVVRPTIFGSAVRDPYPLYGPDSSTPLNKFAQFFLAARGAQLVWHPTHGYRTGANILDETPVDFVANACLLHVAARTTGIVHVGAELFVRRTFDEFIRITQESAPPDLRSDLPTIVFTQDDSAPQCFLAELVKVSTRNWLFDCSRSHWLKQVAGPLSLEACRPEADRLAALRTQYIFNRQRRERAKL